MEKRAVAIKNTDGKHVILVSNCDMKYRVLHSFLLGTLLNSAVVIISDAIHLQAQWQFDLDSAAGRERLRKMVSLAKVEELASKAHPLT